MGKHLETKNCLLARISRSLLLDDWFLPNFWAIKVKLMKWLTLYFCYFG